MDEQRQRRRNLAMIRNAEAEPRQPVQDIVPPAENDAPAPPDIRNPRLQRAKYYGEKFGNFLAPVGRPLSSAARTAAGFASSTAGFVGSTVRFTGQTLYTGTKKYYTDENFESYQKIFLTCVIFICFLFIILSIVYMVKIINDNSKVLQNKDKNEKIINNLFVK